jgi:two-component system response regulator HydG
MPEPSVLIVDDSHDMVDVLRGYLVDHGFRVTSATDGEAAIKAFHRHSPDVVLTDLRMRGFDGLDVLEAIKAADPDTAVVIMTAFGNVESAVDAIQRGAFHYVTKPFKMAAVRVLLERAASQRRARLQGHTLRTSLRTGAAERPSTRSLLGGSEPMQELRRLIGRAADAASPVLIQGETGTGKELVARALHLESSRRDGPFVVVNCGALPERSLESELFGHVRGAFGGGTKARVGLFAEAEGGTLFFDEIGDMPLALQGKLLRVLESGEFRAVGADVPRQVSVRCIASTHRDLQALVATGGFRDDLFFRLAVVPLHLPPLRDRREDIGLLVGHFLARKTQLPAPLDVQVPGAPALAPLYGPGTAPRSRLSESALRVLEVHPWPGNVRELENAVERLLLAYPDQEIGAEAVRRMLTPGAPGDTFDLLASKPYTLEEVEQRYIAAVLQRMGGSKTKAAAILGVDVSTLYRRQKGGSRP